MSTRSGKQIHNSFNETTTNDKEQVLKSERKTRKKRQKENVEVEDKVKKRDHYVRYPTDDETNSVTNETEEKPLRSLRKYTLKDHNITVQTVSDNPETDVVQYVRQTRRTKKFIENITKNISEHSESNSTESEIVQSKSNKKKNKRKMCKSVTQTTESSEKENEEAPAQKKKSRKKKGKRIVLLSEIENLNKNKLNDSNMSVDSFHSTASGPICGTDSGNDNKTDVNVGEESTSSSTQFNKSLNGTFEIDPKKKRKSNSLCKIVISPSSKPTNSTFDKADFDNDSLHVNLDSTFEKDLNKTCLDLQSKVSDNLTDSGSEILNSTFNKPKNCKQTSLDTTFDIETEKFDTTFDKAGQQKSSSDSLISSDTEKMNGTFEKSGNICVSITSDESKTENIINTTPLLIESSFDVSPVSNESSNKMKSESPKDTVPGTPLRREGTFTKDGPDPIFVTSKSNTPNKQILPSPGATPFHRNTKSSSEKSVLNVTRSIEKPVRKSLITEAVPRTTKVMFCSPVNTPAIVTHRKSKIIKSNLKGSNKSFIFDENECSSASRASFRKRSYTLNDAEEARAKRKRLADDQQLSVDRLARPRTCSATAKLNESTTPSKKTTTPTKSRSEAKVARKLPNFAALHQRQFDKMESLDECQDRKARRARQLLGPAGSLAVLERSSPKVTTTEPSKSVAKKPEAVKVAKPPSEAPKSTYTRFGFKLNMDINPFSIPNKNTITKPEDNKPNGVLKRQATLPSLTGATSNRREIARNKIMREKTFTYANKRDEMRQENRTIIKGVRTNRRFELQMRSRNINL